MCVTVSQREQFEEARHLIYGPGAILEHNTPLADILAYQAGIANIFNKVSQHLAHPEGGEYEGLYTEIRDTYETKFRGVRSCDLKTFAIERKLSKGGWRAALFYIQEVALKIVTLGTYKMHKTRLNEGLAVFRHATAFALDSIEEYRISETSRLKPFWPTVEKIRATYAIKREALFAQHNNGSIACLRPLLNLNLTLYDDLIDQVERQVPATQVREYKALAKQPSSALLAAERQLQQAFRDELGRFLNTQDGVVEA